MDKKEYDAGYQAAIEAIKKALSGQSQDGLDGQGGLDSDMQQPPVGNQGKSKSSKNQNSGKSSRTDSSVADGSQGVVRPEDCAGAPGVDDIPNTPGGMISKSDGDKLTEMEGYQKDNANEDVLAKEWGEQAMKNTDKLVGKTAGAWKSVIDGLYKVSTDWKKALKGIIGYSLSPDDKEMAFANKNILASQDRLARTEKDKYDNLSSIAVFIDSSGSMSDKQLKLVLSEVYNVANQKKPMKIILIQCDTQIQEIKQYTDVNKLKFDIAKASVKGRGGTELKACWDLFRNDKKYKSVHPELVMVFTDGYLTQYPRDRKTMNNLCWCILDNTSFEIQHKERNTKCIHLNTADIK